jgi:hypothetical protein
MVTVTVKLDEEETIALKLWMVDNNFNGKSKAIAQIIRNYLIKKERS